MVNTATGIPFAPQDATRDESQLRRFLHGLAPVDDNDLAATAAELAGHTPEPDGALIDAMIGMIDFTSLAGTNTEGSVRALCRRARHPVPDAPDVPPVAAVCVYPDLVEAAADELAGSEVGLASVAGGFPAGRTPQAIKIAEVNHAVAAGATEIDLVLDRGSFLEERYGAVLDGIVAVKQICAHATLKVILETGELGTGDRVRAASWLALLAGADMVKTSTGKVTPAATLPATYLLAEAVRGWYEATGEQRGVKPAGGIRTTDQAARLVTLVREVTGLPELSSRSFRIGASSLLDDLLERRG